MLRTTITLGLISLVTLVVCEDCNSAIVSFQDCVQSAEQPKKNDPAKREDDFKACFTKNGCKEPTFDQPIAARSVRPANNTRIACRKAADDKAQALIKACVQTKTGLVMPIKKDDRKWSKNESKKQLMQGKDEGQGDGGFAQYKSLCSTEQQRNLTKLCLKLLNLNQSKDSGRQNFEKVFNDQCQNKKACFAKISMECQKKINETKEAACECAKSELGGTAGAQLNEDVKKCDNDQHKIKELHPRTFTESAINKICSMKEDRCDKPFKGGNKTTGKGPEGKSGKASGTS